MDEEEFDQVAAWKQIINDAASVTIPKLAKEEIELYNMPKKRNSKTKYPVLSFDIFDENDESMLEYYATNSVEEPKRKRRRRNKKESISIVNESVEQAENNKSVMEAESRENQSFEYKIRVKTAAELGSTRKFSGNRYGPTETINLKSNGDTESERERKMEKITYLYKRYLTPENQEKIKLIVAILQDIADNIEQYSQQFAQIEASNLNEEQKASKKNLVMRSYERKKMERQAKLMQTFNELMLIFESDQFDTIFLLFYLGVLKVFIVSVYTAYKKGTLFKKLMNLFLDSLQKQNMTNHRVLVLLNAPDFRDQCMTLVQLIEMYSHKNHFEMVILSAEDKKNISKLAVNGKDGGSDGALLASGFPKGLKLSPKRKHRQENVCLQPNSPTIGNSLDVSPTAMNVSTVPPNVVVTELSNSLGLLPQSRGIVSNPSMAQLNPRGKLSTYTKVMPSKVKTTKVYQPPRFMAASLAIGTVRPPSANNVAPNLRNLLQVHQRLVNQPSVVAAAVHQAFQYDGAKENQSDVLRNSSIMNNRNVKYREPVDYGRQPMIQVLGLDSRTVCQNYRLFVECSNKNCKAEAQVMCEGCKGSYYCGQKCQAIHWDNGHYQECSYEHHFKKA